VLGLFVTKENKDKMLVVDDAFSKILKIILSTFSLFPEMQNNCSLQKFFLTLLTSKTNANFRKWKPKKYFDKVNKPISNSYSL